MPEQDHSQPRFVVGALGMIFGALAVFAPMPAQAADKLTIGLVTPVSIAQAPFAFGTDLGFYRQENIEYELLPFNATGTLIPQMTAKRIDIGYPNPDFLILARQPGKDYLPLKFFYNVARESVWEIAVPAASRYQTLKDLKGTKMGVFALGQGSIPITRAMFKDIGLEVGKDVELIAVGAAGTATQALNGKQVDALNLFDTLHATIEANGTALRRLPIERKYLNLFSNGYIAHDDTIQSKGKQLAAFGRAWTKSVIACDANPEACVKAFWKAYPNLKPQGDEEQQLKAQVAIMRARLAKVTAFEPGAPQRYGQYADRSWQDFINLLHEQGQIQTTDIKLDTLFTSQFVDEFNAFDKAALIAAAKAAR